MSDAELMAAALFGLEHQRSDIEGKMADIRRAIRSTDLTKSAAMPTRKKRTMSAACSPPDCGGSTEAVGRGEGAGQ
jgi:hypothetical protein